MTSSKSYSKPVTLFTCGLAIGTISYLLSKRISNLAECANETALPNGLTSLSNFVLEEHLIKSPTYNTFKGHFGDASKPAILKCRLNTKSQSNDIVQMLFGTEEIIGCQLKEGKNRMGIGFGSYSAFLSRDMSLEMGTKLNRLKYFSVEIVYPWTDESATLSDQQKVFTKHLKKSTPVELFMVSETYEMYANITQPIIEKTTLAHNQWIYDILNGVKEQAKIIVNVGNINEDDHKYDNDNGFVSAIDSKWRSHCDVKKYPSAHQWRDVMGDESIAQSLAILCLVRDRSIRTLRDLNGDKHLELLKNIRYRTCEAIEDVYGLKMNQLCIFVHYLPQYFHFHIHFACLQSKIGTEVGKAILLEDIIQALERDPQYYQRQDTIIQCRVPGNHPLFQN